MPVTNVRNSQYLKVVEFLSDFLKISKTNIQPSDSLFHDFGVDGDDAKELIRTYADKFNVSVDKFILEEYFGPEFSSPFQVIVEMITRRKFKHTPRLTVEDLAKGVIHGQLFPITRKP